MDTEENLTEETQASDVDVQSEAGAEAVSNPDNLSLSEINEITGKTYKSKEAALKSLKDMSSMAGKVADLMGREEKKEEPGDDRIESLEREVFYSRHPEHEANRDVLEAIAKANGVSIREAIELPAYKRVHEAVTGYQETQQRRTVADSNNRIAQTKSDEDERAAAYGDPHKSAEYVMQNILSK